MNPISFVDVAKLVNRVPGTNIDIDSPVSVKSDQYAIYSGKVSGSGFSFEFYIVYVYAGVLKDGVRSIRTYLERYEDAVKKFKIVYPASVSKGMLDELNKTGVECVSLSRYFLSFISLQTDEYLGKIKSLSFNNYIDPQIEVPAGFIRKFPNPVLSFMNDFEQNKTKGEVAVLLGEPGQGKTFMSKFLAVELAKCNVIPIYVHSEQWSKMQGDDLSSIWKTIVASFRYFEAPISWAEGAERDFMRVSLGLGVFRLIFDGFDEFILWNRGTIDAQDSLRELMNLANEAGTSLCITSRTSFWKSEFETMSDVDVDVDVDEGSLFKFTICPFDINHARNYFDKCFAGDGDSVDGAVRLFDRLKRDSSNDAVGFVGRGFFLTLIADLVGRGYGVDQIGDNGETRLQWIMDALCQREKVRQQLPLDSSQQLAILREFAEWTANGEPRSTATLQSILELITNLDSRQIDQLIKSPAKLKDHPLIRYARDLNSWFFVQDQIEYALLAERILELCFDVSRRPTLQGLLSGKLSNNIQAEVATSIVQQIFENKNAEDGLAQCKEVIAAISSIAFDRGSGESANLHHAFAGQLALLAAGKAHARGGDRTERTSALLSLLPAGRLTGMHFIGSMGGFDFRNIKITDCYFDTVTFTNCRFSSGTEFQNCKFTELRIVNCQQFGTSIWHPSNKLDDLSERLINAEMASSGGRVYDVNNLIADLDCLVLRFLPRETSSLKRVEERNLFRGLIGHSKYKNEIVEIFKKHCLEMHQASGHNVYSVKELCRDEFSFYVANGVFTGELATVRDFLQEKFNL